MFFFFFSHCPQHVAFIIIIIIIIIIITTIIIIIIITTTLIIIIIIRIIIIRIIRIISLFESQIILAEHECCTNWGDVKSNKSNQIKCWFLRRGENRSSRRKTSRSRVENQQTQPTYDAGPGIEPRTHWWKASALTTAPTLLPIIYYPYMYTKFPLNSASLSVLLQFNLPHDFAFIFIVVFIYMYIFVTVLPLAFKH